MLVLTAPDHDDPRDGYANGCSPGELVSHAVICDAGREDACECAELWTGLTTRRTSSIALVVDRPDLNLRSYIDLLVEASRDQWREAGIAVDPDDSEPRYLAEVASHFGEGAVLVSWVEDGQQIIDRLEAVAG